MTLSKICPMCKDTKPLAMFSPDARTRSGVQSRCKPCQANVSKALRTNNPEKHRATVKASTQKNYAGKLQRNAAYRLSNPQKIAAWKRQDRLVNRGRVLADNAYRRAATKQRTVAWADLSAIKNIYEEAQQLSMLVGEWYHVDHVIPLMGKNVCGLHVEDNLQIISAVENLRKGVSYERS
jgi:hypothetical protein